MAWPGADTLIYEKPGYKTLIQENCDIADEEMTVYAGLEMGSSVIQIDSTPHKLRQGNLAGPEAPTKAIPPGPADGQRVA